MRHIRFLLLFFIFSIFCNHLPAQGQQVHPHILVKPEDKKMILKKIQQQPWARTVYDKILQHVTPYVERHQKDPQWILSRYLMNRVPGRRYTRFYSDPQGTRLVGYGGDAPYPTVRVSPHKRPPITGNGYAYRLPSIDELVPYDTSKKMHLQSKAPDGRWAWVDPRSFVGSINGEINTLVLQAAIIYWLTGKEAYGIFASDILSQWARGAFYQQPITGPCRTGFLHIQTLGDDHTVPMILAYDFLYDFLRRKGYDTRYYDTVFQKIAATMTFRGFWNNNWFAAQTPPMVFAALSIDNKKARDYYLNFYLNKDTIRGACGQLALPSLVKKWLTPDGHWKETGGYHNYAIGHLLVSALAMERNGYPVFEKHPALFQASYVMLKYCFPNLKNPAFGDNGSRPSQSPASLEIALLIAKKYNQHKLLNQLSAAMHLLMVQGHYKRSSADYLGLLCYLPQIPAAKNLTYQWPRSGALRYARCFIQRNGTDSLHGLMYAVQGATYNHNHANGMAMELYGEGTVMGPDPGSGLTYDAPLHVHYYAEWAAHNTVVVNARSASVPYFHGGGGAKQIGHLFLAAMEPLAGNTAVSPYCSFTDTRYTDKASGAREQRTMAIIRTSDTTGYYVDIYRCSGKKDNEYLYHNLGDTLQLFSAGRAPLKTVPAHFPISKKPFDPPGFSALKNYRTTGVDSTGIIALFSLRQDTAHPTFMQVLLPGEKQRAYYTAQAPRTRTAGPRYRALPTPVLISRQKGPAWKRPFVAVYEPFSGVNRYDVSRVSLLDDSQTGIFTALKILNRKGGQQIVLQSLDSERVFRQPDWSFRGNFGVIGLEGGKPAYLYIGKGGELSWKGYSLHVTGVNSAANLIIGGNHLKISCDHDTEIGLPGANARKIMLGRAGKERPLSFRKKDNGITFSVPPVKNAEIRIIR
jgi:hypothetical protein